MGAENRRREARRKYLDAERLNGGEALAFDSGWRARDGEVDELARECKRLRALAARPEDEPRVRARQAEIIQRGIEGICNWNGMEYDADDVGRKARGMLDAVLALTAPGEASDVR